MLLNLVLMPCSEHMAPRDGGSYSLTSLIIPASYWHFPAWYSCFLFYLLLCLVFFSLCFQILCLFLCLFTAVADPSRVFWLQLCLLEHMFTGFVTVTACKYLMSDKCLHVLDLPDEAEGDSLTPYWFRVFTLDWLYYKPIHDLCRHFSEAPVC